MKTKLLKLLAGITKIKFIEGTAIAALAVTAAVCTHSYVADNYFGEDTSTESEAVSEQAEAFSPVIEAQAESSPEAADTQPGNGSAADESRDIIRIEDDKDNASESAEKAASGAEALQTGKQQAEKSADEIKAGEAPAESVNAAAADTSKTNAAEIGHYYASTGLSGSGTVSGSVGAGTAGGAASGNAGGSAASADAKDDDNGIHTCSISISCEPFLDDTSDAVRAKLPSDGIILSDTEVEFKDGESVYDVLKRVCRAKKIPYRSSSSIYGAYVSSIDNLSEKYYDYSTGWCYYVDSVYADKSCNYWELDGGESIEWVYDSWSF